MCDLPPAARRTGVGCVQDSPGSEDEDLGLPTAPLASDLPRVEQDLLDAYARRSAPVVPFGLL